MPTISAPKRKCAVPEAEDINRGGKKSKKNEPPEVSIMGEISSSMSCMAKAFGDRLVPTQREDNKGDNYELWARLLAMKLRKVRPKDASRFMVKVDMMALELECFEDE